MIVSYMYQQEIAFYRRHFGMYKKEIRKSIFELLVYQVKL